MSRDPQALGPGAFDAIVLAGGAARRLGGMDKPGLLVGGITLLARVLAAVDAAGVVVVVGPPRPDLPARVACCREDPPGGGPVAAIAAGLEQVSADAVMVLAADLPHVGPAVPALLAALGACTADAAALVDEAGRRNHLCAAWRTDSLRAAVVAVGAPQGVSMRALVASATMIDIVDTHGWGRDCDTWDDVAAAERPKGPHSERA